MTVSIAKIFLFTNFVLMHNLVKCKTLIIDKCATCKDGVEYPSQLFTAFVTRNGAQRMSGNMTLSEDFGDNILVHMKLFLTVGNKQVKMFEANETFCKMMRTYVGPFINDIEKAAEMIPGACPILKGRYHLHDFPLNINKLLIKEVIPYGTLKFIAHHTNTKTEKTILCYEVNGQVF